MRNGLVPGRNVDRLDIAAGMRELTACGWPVTEDGANIATRTVILYSLQRWARGEEEAAQRGAIDKGFHGIPLTCWVRVLAAAQSKAAGHYLNPLEHEQTK
jgi:hypothetical protein